MCHAGIREQLAAAVAHHRGHNERIGLARQECERAGIQHHGTPVAIVVGLLHPAGVWILPRPVVDAVAVAVGRTVLVKYVQPVEARARVTHAGRHVTHTVVERLPRRDTVVLSGQRISGRLEEGDADHRHAVDRRLIGELRRLERHASLRTFHTAIAIPCIADEERLAGLGVVHIWIKGKRLRPRVRVIGRMCGPGEVEVGLHAHVGIVDGLRPDVSHGELPEQDVLGELTLPAHTAERCVNHQLTVVGIILTVAGKADGKALLVGHDLALSVHSRWRVAVRTRAGEARPRVEM